jgi:hypothetical protein
MSARAHVLAFLSRRPAAAYCAACLGRQTELAPLEAQNGMWALHESPGFVLGMGRCSACQLTKRVISAVARDTVTGDEAALITFLLGRRGEALCDACLALGARVSLEKARHAVEYLRPLPEFSSRTGECTVCGRTKPVIAVTTDGMEVDGAPADLAGLATGTARYRGWQIKLLSYQLRDGWRSFSAIQGPEQVAVPVALTIVREQFPTRAEADRFALARAREWIDKRH